MSDLYDDIQHWSLGVVSSAEPDRPELKHAMMRGDNVQFTSIASGKASPRKRLGMTVVNSTPLSNTNSSSGPPIIAGHVYRYTNAGVRTTYNVVVSSTGDVHLVLDDGSSTTHTPTATKTGALSSGITSVDAAQMGNRVFLLDSKAGHTSLLGTAVVNWGVTPATIDSLTIGAAGAMTGDYDVVVTAYDATIDAESDRSDEVSIALTSDKLVITVDAVSNSLTNMHFRVYLRKRSLGSGLFRILTGSGYVSGAQGYPLYAAGATVSTTIDVSDTELVNSVLTPPAVGSRGLPPTTAKYAKVYAGRLFLLDDENLYWSERDLPDAFNPTNYEPIQSPNGGNAIGMQVFAKKLQIFTETGRHTLLGDADRNKWVFDIEDPEIGAVSNASLQVYKKQLWFWNKERGPMVMDEGGGYVHIGEERLGNAVKGAAVNPLYSHLHMSATFDDRVVFGHVEVGETRVTCLLPWHTGVNGWESGCWDPMEAASVFTGFDTNGNKVLYLGNYNGQLFRLLDGGNDGVRTGTRQGTFVASAASISSLTDPTATFDTTGAGLKCRRVVVVDADGRVVTSERITITANTSTALTLSGSVVGLTAGETYTYAVGGADFRFETYWGNMEVPFIKKRFDRLYTELRPDDGVTAILMNIGFTWSTEQNLEVALDDASSQLWDAVDWDEATWDDQTVLTRRTPIIRNGLNYKALLRNPYPDQGFTLLKLSVLARKLSDRISA